MRNRLVMGGGTAERRVDGNCSAGSESSNVGVPKLEVALQSHRNISLRPCAQDKKFIIDAKVSCCAERTDIQG